MFQSVEELSQKLSETGYFIDPTMTKVVFLADQMKKPLLLEGPAGSGKTEIGRTLANESGLGFLAATTADVKANFLGQSGNRVKQLFERARANAPVILFLDELDIIAPAWVATIP